MPPTPTEFQDKYKVSLGFMVWFIMGSIMATFSLTMIYNRFLLTEEEMTQQSDRIEYVNGRVDRKVSDVDEKITELEDRLSYLENLIYSSSDF